MPVTISGYEHRCPGDDVESSYPIKFNLSTQKWEYQYVEPPLLEVNFCPFCGEKLEQPDA